MPSHFLWRCRRCGNVVAKTNAEGKPSKCFNCRSGATAAGDLDLYERLDNDVLEDILR